jgi:hypothetical protein
VRVHRHVDPGPSRDKGFPAHRVATGLREHLP